MVVSLLKYEDANIEYYSDSDLTKRVMTHPSNNEFKERFDEVARKWKNPYKDAYYWLKGELLDLKGLNEALAGREQVVKQQSSTESKKRDN
jgi:hypothetical protein